MECDGVESHATSAQASARAETNSSECELELARVRIVSHFIQHVCIAICSVRFDGQTAISILIVPFRSIQSSLPKFVHCNRRVASPFQCSLFICIALPFFSHILQLVSHFNPHGSFQINSKLTAEVYALQSVCHSPLSIFVTHSSVELPLITFP